LPKSKCEFSGPGALIIWGGGDIHPSLYGRPNYASGTGKTLSDRDVVEVKLLEKAIEAKIPILGICRGAQLGCAAAGGILIQHVNEHGRSHMMATSDGKEMVTSSLHHQMMFPWEVEHELIAWASPARSNKYVGITEEEAKHIPKKEELYIEPEIVWFPKIKCLAIQGHPEFMDNQCLFNLYIKELCGRYGINHS
jgi:gamma-glutamyl-gamma-aminobutyrate hydrolase PuuD